MTAEDREFLLALMRDRSRLDTVIAAMKRGDRESYEIIATCTDLFNAGHPCCDERGRLGRLTEDRQ